MSTIKSTDLNTDEYDDFFTKGYEAFLEFIELARKSHPKDLTETQLKAWQAGFEQAADDE